VRLLAVAVGGAAGAVARYALSGWVAHLAREGPFPYGTLAVNALGSLALGFVMGATTAGRLALGPDARAALTVGVLGAFTTFSTFSYETVQAARLGDLRVAAVNVAASLALGLAACWLGLRLGRVA